MNNCVATSVRSCSSLLPHKLPITDARQRQ